jgi:hypothetical protein
MYLLKRSNLLQRMTQLNKTQCAYLLVADAQDAML